MTTTDPIHVDTMTLENGFRIKRAFHEEYPTIHAVLYQSGWSFFGHRDGYLGGGHGSNLDAAFREYGKRFA